MDYKDRKKALEEMVALLQKGVDAIKDDLAGIPADNPEAFQTEVLHKLFGSLLTAVTTPITLYADRLGLRPKEIAEAMLDARGHSEERKARIRAKVEDHLTRQDIPDGFTLVKNPISPTFPFPRKES